MTSGFKAVQEITEIERLNYFVPSEMRSKISILDCRDLNHLVITTEANTKKQFTIKINFRKWQELKSNQRDLLFLHEISKIEGRTVAQTEIELPVIGVGLCVALVEISQHNVISLSAALMAVGLATYQLYQRKWGEKSLREVCTADRRAIYLATEFGYSPEKASSSLYNALQMLSRGTSKSQKQKYQVRLRSLEILAKLEDLELA